MDPRVDVSAAALSEQLALERKILDLVATSYDFYRKAVALRQSVGGDEKQVERHAGADAAIKAIQEFDAKARKLQGADTGFGGRGARQAPAFAPLNRSIGSLASVVDGQDAAPTPVMQSAYQSYCHDLASAAQSWNQLLKTDLANLNGEIAQQKLAPLSAEPLPVPACKAAWHCKIHPRPDGRGSRILKAASVRAAASTLLSSLPGPPAGRAQRYFDGNSLSVRESSHRARRCISRFNWRCSGHWLGSIWIAWRSIF
jgi:hypothetical protein